MPEPFKFDCPRCGQRLEAEKSLIGESFACPTCHNELTVPGKQSQPVSPNLNYTTLKVSPPRRQREKGGGRAEYFICSNPNCDFRGNVAPETMGSVSVFCVLLLFGVFPAILYWLFCIGQKFICPKCSIELRKKV